GPFGMLTDCTISRGDSGGPLFDLQGNVIGIHSQIAAGNIKGNWHISAARLAQNWDKLLDGQVTRIAPRSRLLACFDRNLNGSVEPGELPEGIYAETYQRLLASISLDPTKTHSVDKLREALGLSIVADEVLDRSDSLSEFEPFRVAGTERSTLDIRQHTRGASNRKQAGQALSPIRDSVVQFRSGNQPLAFGVVIDRQGLVLTKASEVAGWGDKLLCLAGQGGDREAELLASDSRTDLALVRVSPPVLSTIDWSTQIPELGTWVGTMGLEADPVSLGVIGGPVRRIAATPGFLGISAPSDRPPVVIRSVMPGGPAQRAGVLSGDVLTAMNGAPINRFQDIRDTVKELSPGEVIQFQLTRGEATKSLQVTLGTSPDDRRSRAWDGPVSRRRSDFSAAFHHDSVIAPSDCGTPVVDLEGNVLGLNIARVGRSETLAIPATEILRAIGRMQAQIQSLEDQ
ncbi:MAG: PDZ domain-containing protein, partial [Planctomycetota bacterium]